MNPVRAWNTFWFQRVSSRPLGAFRIVFGVLVLCNLGFLAFDLDYWFTDVGIIRGSEAAEIAGPFRYSILHVIRNPLAVRVYFAGTALIALAFTIGWRTRAMGVAQYLALLSIHHRNIVTNSGADALLLIMSFYLMLSPCGASFSLDARRVRSRRGTDAEPLILPWAQRLIQLQLSVIYFTTALMKCHGASWLNGTAMHFVLNNTEVGRPGMGLAWLTEYPVVINLMTHGAIVIEFALAFLLWSRATRPWLILAGLGLHVGILFTVNIPIFGELMCACYLTFLKPDELDRLLQAFSLRRWLPSRRSVIDLFDVGGRVDVGSPIPLSHLRESSPKSLSSLAEPSA